MAIIHLFHKNKYNLAKKVLYNKKYNLKGEWKDIMRLMWKLISVLQAKWYKLWLYLINVDNKLATKILLNDEYNILHFWETCLQYLKEKCLKEGDHFKPIEMLLSFKTFLYNNIKFRWIYFFSCCDRKDFIKIKRIMSDKI